jgi:putative ABC transport system permease protein
LYAPVLAAQGEQALSGMVVGVDAAVERLPGGLLTDVSPSVPLGNHQIIVGQAFALKLKTKPGDKLAVIGSGADGSIANDLYTVAAVAPSYVDLVNSQGIVMALADAQDLFVLPDAAHELLIRGPSASDAEALAARLAALPALKGLEVLSWRQAAPEFIVFVDIAGASAIIAVLLVCLAAAAGIANTVMMSIFEQTHEFGTLLALGCSPARLVRQVLLESVFLGVSGVALGTAIGLLLVLFSAGHPIDLTALGGKAAADTVLGGLRFPMYLTLRPDIHDILNGALGVVVTALLSAAWPASVVARLQPVEAMHA